MTSQKKTYLIDILIIIGLVLLALIPVGSWVMAQEELKQFSSSHSIPTSDFGIESPAGMAYSPEADSFMVWAAENAFHIIKSQEEMASKINLVEPVENPISMAFEDQSKSLFVLGSGNTQLAKISTEQGGLPNLSKNFTTHFNISSFDLQDAQGLTFDSATGRLFILDARQSQVLVALPHPEQGFDGVTAQANNRIRRLSLESLSDSGLRGIAFNPNNGHLYVGSPDERKVYEITETGERVSTYDVSDLNLDNPATMLFAPSRDVTDDPTIMDLYILDSGQNLTQDSVSAMNERNTSQMGKIVALSLQAPAVLPPGTTLLPATLVHTIDTSNASWSPSAPDPAGIDYWPLTGRLLIVDSEVDEMPPYWMGKNVFQSTTSGTLDATCSTTSFTAEPTGVAINPTNNHIFFPSDFNDSIFEVSLGPDGAYCTSDDTVTATNVNNLYNIQDAEDVAYGNNTLFIAGGDNAEVYRIPLGPNGVFGGGDDGAMTHFDTAALGFSDMESLGYNADANTLFLASPKPSEKYLGETSTSGALLRAYDLAFMGTAGNIRSDVTYAPDSQNSGLKNIYIASRGVDNDDNRFENDGKVWEIRISNPIVPTPTPTNTPPPTPIRMTLESNGTFDGWILESSETSNQGGGMNAITPTFNLGDNASNKQYRAIVSFCPDSLPSNAIITKAVLRIKKNGLVGTNPFTTHNKIAVDIRQGSFSNNLSLQLTDFQAAASMATVGLISNIPQPGDWYLANLNASAFPFIHFTSCIQLRLRFQLDDNNDLSADFLRFYSGDSVAKPKLILTYTLP